MKILVSGATGFIGLPLLHKLVEKGHEILALTRTPHKDFKSITFLKADLSHPMTYSEIVSAFKPEVVIHLAWEGIPNFSFENSKNNLNNSLNFFSYLISLGCCKKFIVSGSCFEFNNFNGECLESDQGIPKDHFTWAKHSLLSWLKLECKNAGIQFGWLRIFYVYGPRQRIGSLIPSIVSDLKTGNLPQIRTPMNSNDFIYIDDVIAAFENAVLMNYPSGIYNLGSGSSTPIIEVCKIAEKIIIGTNNLSQKLKNETENTIISTDFWANISESKKHLNWHPTISLEQGITKTWQWLQSK